MSTLDRRQFLESAAFLGIAGTVFPGVLFDESVPFGEVTLESIAHAEAVAGVSFTPAERELMLEGLNDRLGAYSALREMDLSNEVIPCQFFDPQLGSNGVQTLEERPHIEWEPHSASMPSSDEDLAFSSISILSSLLKERRIQSVDLVDLYLARLKKYNGVLEAVVTVTEERAYEMARKADTELDQGNWRGPLHGIPWGAKDLLSVKGYPTTWGAAPYKDQMIDRDASVVTLLDEAGAVLVAKLALGALAMGDVWFDGKTRNPWNIEVGSSGSSAGPGSAVAAGLVGFAIGSETLGSIVSPSTRNGVTGLRPTFGRVSRAGAMTLSWTMDKLGPMCHSAEDCALVFSQIHGRDEKDPTTLTAPFNWPAPKSLQQLRIGYLKSAFDRDYRNKASDEAVLDILRGLGAELISIELPDYPMGAILIMLSAEAGAAFDQLTVSGRANELVRQDSGAWPNTFRKSQLIPAVDYINASRARTVLMQEMKKVMAAVDVFVSPTRGGSTLSITNLTGHPSVTVPNRFAPVGGQTGIGRRNPASITFIGGLYKDSDTLAVAHVFQSVTDFHLKRPPIA